MCFNIYNTVSNKTEARSTAEWSLQSTPSYDMVVASNHFVAGIKKTLYHPRKTELSEDSVELWNKVELEHKLMLGNKLNQVKMYPILPNLITITDEITIFATTNVLNSKEQLNLVSKPDEIKNKSVNSG